VFEAEGLHVRLRFGLPLRRDKTAGAVTAAAHMVQRKRSISHMSQPSFGGRRFLLLGVLAALRALRFIRAPSAYTKTRFTSWWLIHISSNFHF
jgi:hypothetical protein